MTDPAAADIWRALALLCAAPWLAASVVSAFAAAWLMIVWISSEEGLR